MRRTSKLGVESLLDLALMEDAEDLATMKLLIACFPAAFQTDHQLYTLLCSKLVLLSLDNGNSPWSARAYCSFAGLLSAGFGRHREANEFAKLGVELAEKFGDLTVYSAVNFLRAAFASHWVEPLDVSISLFTASVQYGLQTGDHSHAAYSNARRFGHLQQRGMQLADLSAEAEKVLHFFNQIGETANVPYVEGRQRLAHWLMGRRACGDTLGTADLSEEEFTAATHAARNLSFESDWYAVLIQQRYFAGNYAAAHQAAVDSAAIVPFSSPFVAHQ
jgi:predicted ATPase